MHRTEFRSDNPLNDLPRALDILRKLNYRLGGVTMTAPAGEPARIAIAFEPSGALSVETFLALIERLPDIDALVHAAPDTGPTIAVPAAGRRLEAAMA